ncbi:RNA polymerase sigma-70 factor, ECF subfamily protein [Enhygromyxa salina]|uniref:RNA polymerase sigma-70 factor, ECF subfamily protein n=1 Tax=Enhygromyxa salina TaxID=215803 RepID=A0A0C2D085_9BACT|nr:sigma-70 family RNA polymerase sigma factor [Enhygromyxa salina]KIG16646.1 RNA polymerase sigma-70 factor, ECF subfamily protein [Enhygromyxa salina]
MLDWVTESFEAQRPRLLRIAYRMLGSHAEAEDVVQDAWLRWYGTDHAGIRKPAAWLTRIVTRLCLNRMNAARARHETYPGTWLPEPLIEPEPDDDLRLDHLTLTLMMALERLSPLERAAFLLHDVFGQPLGEVASTIDRSPAATRQLASRARAHVQVDRPRNPVSRETGAALTKAFFNACSSGDTQALGAILADDVTLHSDGGGKIRSFNVIRGAERVVRLYAGLARKLGSGVQMISSVVIDGLPGFVSRIDDALQTTALEIDGERITRIYITRNPDKLRSIRLH